MISLALLSVLLNFSFYSPTLKFQRLFLFSVLLWQSPVLEYKAPGDQSQDLADAMLAVPFLRLNCLLIPKFLLVLSLFVSLILVLSLKCLMTPFWTLSTEYRMAAVWVRTDPRTVGFTSVHDWPLSLGDVQSSALRSMPWASHLRQEGILQAPVWQTASWLPVLLELGRGVVSGLTGQGTNYHLVPRVAQCPVLSRATAQSPQLRRPMSSLLRGWGKDLGLHHAQMLLVVPPASHFQRIQHTSSSPHSLSTFCPGFHHSLVYQSDTCPSLFSFPDFIAVAYCPLLFYCCCFMALKELSAILVGFQEGAVISEWVQPATSPEIWHLAELLRVPRPLLPSLESTADNTCLPGLFEESNEVPFVKHCNSNCEACNMYSTHHGSCLQLPDPLWDDGLRCGEEICSSCSNTTS